MTRDLALTGNPAADAELTANPFALLVGMLLDQQIPLERAFAGPYAIAERLSGAGSSLDPRTVAGHDPEAFAGLCSRTPAVHRFPGAMAGRVQALAREVVDSYGGDAAAIWRDASAKEVVRRLRELPGFGPAKARIFLALLAKQLDVRPEGWEAETGELGEPGVYRSVADVVDEDSLARVRAYKQELKRSAKKGR